MVPFLDIVERHLYTDPVRCAYDDAAMRACGHGSNRRQQSGGS